jgi:hypothetical protein
MKPIKHPNCNDILRKPDGMTEEECGDLHIRRDSGFVWSFWKPDAEELLALNRGGSVALSVMGETHPPLSVLVARPFEPFGHVVTEAEYRSRMEAVNGRMSALISLTKQIVSAWGRTSADNTERQRLVDQFLDLLYLNRSDGEIVGSLPEAGPEPTTTQVDADRYRSDAEGWKAEAERWRKVAEESTMTDGQRTTDAGGWMNYCLEAERELAKARDAVRLLSTTAQELDAVMNPHYPN